MRSGILLAVLGIALAGCVTQPTATSSIDPGYARSAARARVVVVGAPNLPPDERLAAESEMASVLSGKGIQIIKALDLLPPDRGYSPEQVVAALIDAKAEALLVFRGRPGERNIFVAGGRYIPTQTYRSEQAFGNGVVRITTVQASSGAVPYTYDVDLVYPAAPQPAWRAEIVAQGGNGASFRDLAASAAREAAAKLLADKAL